MHHSTCQTVYPQFLHSVHADTGWGRLAQWITFCQEQELDLENEVSPTVAQPPGTLFLPTSTTLLTPVHSQNHSGVYCMIVLTTDYCWRSWMCLIAAHYKFHVDLLIKLIDWLAPMFRCSDYDYRESEVLWWARLCVCVCLPARSSLEIHARSSLIFLCMLLMATARSCSGGVVIRYVLPVLWMTSYLFISQGWSTSPPSWSAVHTQPWAWLQTVRSNTSCRPTYAQGYFSGT